MGFSSKKCNAAGRRKGYSESTEYKRLLGARDRMIYRSMPAVRDPAFRQTFYARWGGGSAVISAYARRTEYPEFRQLLSIEAAADGAESLQAKVRKKI